MSDNFWDRDYVIEHLRVNPNDRAFLESLRTLGDDVTPKDVIFDHVVDFDDIEWNTYLHHRNRGLSHWDSSVRIYNSDRYFPCCDRIGTLEEVEFRTCYKCSTEAALRG
jgi:hypothetical protein